MKKLAVAAAIACAVMTAGMATAQDQKAPTGRVVPNKKPATRPTTVQAKPQAGTQGAAPVQTKDPQAVPTKHAPVKPRPNVVKPKNQPERKK